MMAIGTSRATHAEAIALAAHMASETGERYSVRADRCRGCVHHGTCGEVTAWDIYPKIWEEATAYWEERDAS